MGINMNKVIKDIIDRNCTNEEKNKALNSLTNEIEIAKDILSGKYKFCPKCGDYYLAKSFLTEQKTISTEICVYKDPINSGGDEYVDGYIDITYDVCPKGHREETNIKERMK